MRMKLKNYRAREMVFETYLRTREADWFKNIGTRTGADDETTLLHDLACNTLRYMVAR